MLVEFTGVTGAGKTTLMGEVKRSLARRNLSSCGAQDAVLAMFGLRRFLPGGLASLAVSACSLPAFLRFARSPQGSRLVRFAFGVLRRDAGRLGNFVRLARNLVKRFGMYRLLRCARVNPVSDFVLWDEGTVHSVHNLFVHAGAALDREELARYLAVVPKPDLVVHVTASAEQSVQVTLARGHARVGAEAAAVRTFISTARTVFDVLTTAPTLQDRLFLVDNTGLGPSGNGELLKKRAELVADFLARHAAARGTALPCHESE